MNIKRYIDKRIKQEISKHFIKDESKDEKLVRFAVVQLKSVSGVAAKLHVISKRLSAEFFGRTSLADQIWEIFWSFVFGEKAAGAESHLKKRFHVLLKRFNKNAKKAGWPFVPSTEVFKNSIVTAKKARSVFNNIDKLINSSSGEERSFLLQVREGVRNVMEGSTPQEEINFLKQTPLWQRFERNNYTSILM